MVRFEPLTTGVVTSESVSRSSTITDNPVEGGSNIQDHVFTQPLSFQISGTAINGADTIAALQKMWKSGDIITYTGRNRISNLVIQQLQSTHDAKNRGGFTFTKAAQKSSSQTSSTKADGLKTTVSTTISSSAYMSYVNSFNSKPKSNAGPTSRATPSNTGRR